MYFAEREKGQPLPLKQRLRIPESLEVYLSYSKCVASIMQQSGTRKQSSASPFHCCVRTTAGNEFEHCWATM